MFVPTKCVGNHVGFSEIAINPYIITLDQFQPFVLSQVEIYLREDVLETLVVAVDLTSVADEIMPPNLEGVHNCC